MNRFAFIFLLFLCSSEWLTAQDIPVSAPEKLTNTGIYDTLIGMLPSIIKNKHHPYLVPSNIEVPPDRTVTIEPGTVLLFKNFAGLHVRGRLLARGTAEEPIIFSSEYDRIYASQSIRDANPFDWDGIYMTTDALGSQLTYCTISYSVYCISSDSKFIRLDPIVVKDNGKSVITIENTEYPLTDTLFTYTLDKKDITKEGATVDLFRDPVAKKRNTFRVLGSVLMFGGAGSCVYYALELNKSNDELKRLNGTDFENLNIHNSSDWNNAEKDVTKNKWLISVGSFAFLAGLACFTWTFTF